MQWFDWENGDSQTAKQLTAVNLKPNPVLFVNVMWQKDFEAVKDLFGVARGVRGLEIQPEDIHWIATTREFQPFLHMMLGTWKEECIVLPWTITMPLHTYGRAKDMSRNGACPPNDKL